MYYYIANYKLCLSTAKENDKDLTTWETYLKEKKLKKKKKTKETSTVQDFEESSEIVILYMSCMHVATYWGEPERAPHWQ